MMLSANIILIGAFLLLLLLGTPIAVALGLSGVAGILTGLDQYALGTVGTNTYNSIAKYPLIAIPLFVLTGVIFERSGVARRLVEFAAYFVGPRRGGLAVVAIVVCMIMGGMAGSGPADAAAVATVMIPSMRRAGYPNAFSASVIAAAASTAILIPPSIALIVYGVMVPGTDIRALFAAGLTPGLLAGIFIAIPTLIISRKHGFGATEAGDAGPKRRFMDIFIQALPGLMAPVIILGGLRSGLFTPTETAVVAVFYGIFIGLFVYRELRFRDIYKAMAESAETSAVIMLIIALAGIFAWAGGTLGAFDSAANALLSITDNGWVILAAIMVILLFAGMLLDGVSIYLITLPLIIPVAQTYDWNLTWLGVLMALNIAIGQFTPPVAVNLIVTARIARVPIESTVPWVIWMVLSMVVLLGLMMAVPDIALWLPKALGYVV
ncbi:C4-dicarboxylate ABC transporter [Tistrella bauzanensis]|uniref:TRAP transporter large permease protein n=1 Tax=Tistrella bauzanensis TaxID=657419 RepID=A0ABQ1JB78_9PROT|nr:C4-dicarboxylate ABC transporter [Tistrella bauzanensis]